MPKRVVEITQEDVNNCDVKISLVDGQELRFERKGILSKQESRINILVLKDKGKRKVTFGWKWFYILLVVCLLLLPKSLYLLFIPGSYLELAFYGGLMVCMYCLFMIWETTTFRQVFCARNTNIPVFEMAIGKPTKKIFSRFVNELEESIQNYRKQADVPGYKQIKGEIKTLRRLSEQGVVSTQDYERAKKSLLKQF